MDKPITLTRAKVPAQGGGPAKLKPDTHTPGKVAAKIGNKSNNNLPKKSGATDECAFPLFQELELKTRGHFTVTEADRNISELRRSAGGCQQYCGKVTDVEQGLVPLEFKLMLKLDHTNLMKIHEIVFNESKSHCMAVTDWITNATYRRLDALERTAIAKGILSALDYLHNLNIVHANVKISNIMSCSGLPDLETRHKVNQIISQ